MLCTSNETHCIHEQTTIILNFLQWNFLQSTRFCKPSTCPPQIDILVIIPHLFISRRMVLYGTEESVYLICIFITLQLYFSAQPLERCIHSSHDSIYLKPNQNSIHIWILMCNDVRRKFNKNSSAVWRIFSFVIQFFSN